MTAEKTVLTNQNETFLLRVLSDQGSEVLELSKKIAAESEAIRELEEITQAIDSPFIGSYFSS